MKNNESIKLLSTKRNCSNCYWMRGFLPVGRANNQLLFKEFEVTCKKGHIDKIYRVPKYSTPLSWKEAIHCGDYKDMVG